MGKRKRFDYTILQNCEHLNSYALYNLDIPSETKSEFFEKFVTNGNLMPVLLTFVDISFIAEEDKANGVIVEILNEFISESEDGIKELIKNRQGEICKLEYFINEHDLNSWTKISGLKVKSIRKVLTNQVSPYSFSENGIEVERTDGKTQKQKLSQMGEE